MSTGEACHLAHGGHMSQSWQRQHTSSTMSTSSRRRISLRVHILPKSAATRGTPHPGSTVDSTQHEKAFENCFHRALLNQSLLATLSRLLRHSRRGGAATGRIPTEKKSCSLDTSWEVKIIVHSRTQQPVQSGPVQWLRRNACRGRDRHATALRLHRLNDVCHQE